MDTAGADAAAGCDHRREWARCVRSVPCFALHLVSVSLCSKASKRSAKRRDLGGAMATPSSKNSEVPNTVRVDWNEADLKVWHVELVAVFLR